MAQKRLLSELGNLHKEKWVHLEVDERNIFSWKIGLMVINPESVFNGAYLCAHMRFSRDYPYAPPSFKFDTRDIHHPNVYPDGRVCISILHTPGDDEQSGEEASERWSPLQGVESVLRSVLLLLDEPETNSPANVDASVLYRSDRAKYDARARETARSSRVQKPDDVHFPSQAELEPTPVKVPEDDSFWNESEPEDFSDSEFAYEDEDDDEEQEGDESG